MSENPNWIAWDAANDEPDENRVVEVNGVEVSETSSGSGADASASYVTTEAESELESSTQHADLSGSDLHDPAEHDNTAHSTDYAAASDLQSHESDSSNPHGVTNDQVGVTSDTNTDGNYEITIDGDTYELVSE